MRKIIFPKSKFFVDFLQKLWQSTCMIMSESEIEMFAKVTVEEFEDEFLAQEEFLRNEQNEGEEELTEMSVADLMPNV